MKKEKDIPVNDELMVKYLSGEASPEEALALTEWLQAAGNRALFAQVEAVWYGTHPHKIKKPRFSKEHAWSSVAVNLGNTIHTAPARRLWPAVSSRIMAVAASFLLLAAFGLFLFLRRGPAPKNNIVSTTENSRLVTLADNSKATVNRNTTLAYPVEFSGNKREVSLVQGEAFFVITPDKAKPFIVHTALADVKVVGTEFDVVAADDKVEISVKEGKVMVYTSHDSLYLTKGTSGVFTAGEKKISTGTVSDANTWSYATRRLVFRDTPLKTVIKDIERAYPCSIRVTNQNINKCNLTATFDNDSMDNVVTLIAEILNLTVTKDDKIFILEGEGCP